MAAPSIPKTEKTWITALGGISMLFILGRLFLSGDGTLDIQMMDTYFVIEGGKWVFLLLLWGLYFFHLGLQTMSGWGSGWKKAVIAMIILSMIVNVLAYKYFYNTYMLPGAFDWPLNDEEARKILLKQQEVLKQAFLPIAVPIVLFFLMQCVRLVQLIISKTAHADPGQPTT